MGRDIEVTDFSSADYKKFSDRLYDCLSALKSTLSTPGFGEGPITLGAELESYIVDDKGDVAPINDRILSHMNDNQFQHELNKFNLEYNLSPVAAKGTPFSKMQQEIETALAKAAQAAALYDARIVPIGILPTLSLNNLQADHMTDLGRYHMLYKGLHQLRGEAFKININGDDPIQLESDLVTLEGANTSFQIHLRVAPDDFAKSFNAAQMVTPLAVALSANSPILLGHRLWQETRVALFKQSIDSRLRGNVEWRQPSRVSFGHGWVRQDAHELFAETVALYPPIIPVLSPENPLTALGEKSPPKLDELNLHMGTTWPWNRAVYSSDGDGHLRIEMRAVPSGPTPLDMMANAAFFIGLTVALRENISDVLPSMPFRFAEYNFYRAAQNGLKADVLWPVAGQTHPTEQPIYNVIKSYLPHMAEGLDKLGVTAEEISKYITNLEDRLRADMTGARWQLMMLEKYEQQCANRLESCHAMTQRYIQQQQSGKPMVEWSLTP